MANYYGTATPVYGTNQTLMESKAFGTYPNASAAKGQLYCSTDLFIAPTGDSASGSIIKCGRLPKGAVVSHTTIMPVDTTTGQLEAGANAVTGTVGITDINDPTVYDVDYLGTFTTLAAAAAVQTMYPTPDGTIHTANSPLTYTADVYVTTGGAAIAATDGFILKVFYTLA